MEAPGSAAACISALRYAPSGSDLTIIVEPSCRQAMPDDFLWRLNPVQRIVGKIGQPRLKILFDCNHVQTEHGDVVA